MFDNPRNRVSTPIIGENRDICQRCGKRPANTGETHCPQCKHTLKKNPDARVIKLVSRSQDPLVRFWQKVDKSGECWLWLARRDKNDYGQFNIQGKPVRAVRWIYEQENGEIPEGLVVNHLCENKPCVRPEHLEIVSTRDNLMYSDTPARRNAQKTHCPKGHPYSGDNLMIVHGGRRRCRLCDNEGQLRRYHERQAKKRASKADPDL